jgi:hypothetical protein
MSAIEQQFIVRASHESLRKADDAKQNGFGLIRQSLAPAIHRSSSDAHRFDGRER